MANKYINVATLTWLDRRQLWATTNRTSSLGINTVSVHPSTLGGQGSRPGVSHRHFSPSLSWFVSATFAILGLALASALALFAIRAALCLAFKRLTLVVDKTLAPRAKGQRRQTAYTYIDLQPLGLSVDFANLVYSLVGSFDVASSHMPICKKTPLIGHSSWEISPLSLPLNG
jgi:hypothetical protein